MSYKFMLHKDGIGAYWEERQHLFDVLMGRKDALESTAALSGLVAAGGAAGAIGSKDKGGQALGSAVAVSGLIGSIVSANKAGKIMKEEIPNAVLELSRDFELRISPLIHEYNKFVEDFPGDAVAHIMELQIAQEYHTGMKLIAAWQAELEEVNIELIRHANNNAEESVRWCSRVSESSGIVYQAAQATIMDVQLYQGLLQDSANKRLMEARFKKLREIGLLKSKKGDIGDMFLFKTYGGRFTITHSDISVEVKGNTLSVPIEEFDKLSNSPSATERFLRSMIERASRVKD